MRKIDLLKRGYNNNLKRYNNALKYFSTHSIAECEKQINLFNKVVRNLSVISNEFEKITNRKMTHDEKENGFSL